MFTPAAIMDHILRQQSASLTASLHTALSTMLLLPGQLPAKEPYQEGMCPYTLTRCMLYLACACQVYVCRISCPLCLQLLLELCSQINKRGCLHIWSPHEGGVGLLGPVDVGSL